MMELFDGFRHAYGTYSAQLASVDGSQKLKGRAISVPRDVTAAQWEQHISGELGLGIIPINEASEVKFAAIDIDSYENLLQDIHAKIKKFKLPMIACRTKSGGVHAYLFMREFTDAGIVQKRMREFAAILGHGNAEIFPKQTKIVPERGDIGQWINIPYFNAGNTNRYALDDEGEPMNALDFVEHCRGKMLSIDELLAVSTKVQEAFVEGPPCINHLAALGLPEGTRNNALFNMAVYAKKVHPENWEAHIEDYNKKYLHPSLPSTEVLGIIKSMRKKDFFYTCKQPPICNFCNMPECRRKKHGIGTSGTGLPKFGTLSKLMTEPVIWFLEVEGGGRLELATEDLQNQRKFQNRCIESLNVMPTLVAGEDWQSLIQGLLESVTIVEMPVEITPSGLLKRHLEEFCTGRVQANVRDEILNGKPWTDAGYHWFRMDDFMSYLERRKFRELELRHIGMWFREWKAEKQFLNLKGKGVTVTRVPLFRTQQVEKFDSAIGSVQLPYT